VACELRAVDALDQFQRFMFLGHRRVAGRTFVPIHFLAGIFFLFLLGLNPVEVHGQHPPRRDVALNIFVVTLVARRTPHFVELRLIEQTNRFCFY